MLEGKKISELDQIDTLSLGSSFPVLDKGATKRIAFSALLNKIENELPESDIDKVKNDVEKLKVKTESINTLTTEMEAVKDQVSGVDEMVQGQNATIRNCVSAVEGLEQVIETTHFDDVLALEEQVHANTTNVEKKLNKTTDSANAGKAVVVDENGNLVFGAAGVQVSKAEGNAIEEKEDGIYVPLAEGIKITELEEVETLQDGGCFPVVSEGVNKRITKANLFNLFKNEMKNEMKTFILETYYPIGALYLTMGDENPGTLFGGTWEKSKMYVTDAVVYWKKRVYSDSNNVRAWKRTA